MFEGVIFVFGFEVVGVVVKVGVQVIVFMFGDCVCVLINGGGYVEYCVVLVGQMLLILVGFSFSEVVVILEIFFIVWVNVFQLGKLQSGESILVYGGVSGIGIIVVLLCYVLGMIVYVIVGQDEKIVVLCFYVMVINYKIDDFVEKIGQLINDEGVDVILDIVGGFYFNCNFGLLKKDG